VHTLSLRSTGPDDTRALAGALAEHLVAGDLVALSGELGAGKTAFVQGAARALGVPERVTSPSFVLVKSYRDGRLPVIHADVYRLGTLQDVLELGDEVLDPSGVTFVEWADAIGALLPDDRVEVVVGLAEVDAPDGDRVLTVRLCGRTRERAVAMAHACSPWRARPSVRESVRESVSESEESESVLEQGSEQVREGRD
jgi:tRNA threonylcarbamoyladenosine biosynthesis protein TsaE